jgi:transcriptional regulator with XRE-family HTH domain
MSTSLSIPDEWRATLRRLRLASELTQAELAQEIKCARRTIQNIEAGHTTPKPGTIKRLRRALPGLSSPYEYGP